LADGDGIVESSDRPAGPEVRPMQVSPYVDEPEPPERIRVAAGGAPVHRPAQTRRALDFHVGPPAGTQQSNGSRKVLRSRVSEHDDVVGGSFARIGGSVGCAEFEAEKSERLDELGIVAADACHLPQFRFREEKPPVEAARSLEQGIVALGGRLHDQQYGLIASKRALKETGYG
jgi:hypothetical protein